MRRLAWLLPLVLLAACGDSGGERPESELESLETEDIGAVFDAGLSTEEDQKGRPREDPEVAGVLPGDFPGDIPLVKPSSIVDFGELSDGRHYVEIDTSVPLSRVSADLARDLAGFGWAGNGDPASGGSAIYSKGGRVLGLGLTDLSPGTRIRYEY